MPEQPSKSNAKPTQVGKTSKDTKNTNPKPSPPVVRTPQHNTHDRVRIRGLYINMYIYRSQTKTSLQIWKIMKM